MESKEIIKVFKEGIANKQIPRFLYKYTSVENLQSMLEGSTLKFSGIEEFNDLRECFAVIEGNSSDEDWVRYLIEVSPSHLLLEIPKIAQRCVWDYSFGRNVVEKAIQSTNASLGILCLTSQYDNDTMWAHYADMNQGVCLEFDMLEDLPTFCFPKKVVYDDNICHVDYIKDYVVNKGKTVTDAIYHKTSKWSYEDEYRVVKINGQGIKRFNIRALSSICFGAKTSEDDINAIKKLCASKRYNHISFYKMTLNPQTGALTRNPL